MKQGTGRESWDKVTWRAWGNPPAFILSVIGHTQGLYILGEISVEVLQDVTGILWASYVNNIREF